MISPTSGMAESEAASALRTPSSVPKRRATSRPVTRGSTPRSAATAASRLVAADVCAAIGTYGSAVTEASQDIYDEAGIVQIGTGSTSIRLTAKGMKRFFRTCPRDDEQGRVAQSTLAKFGFQKVAILHDNSAYAKGLADEARQRIIDKKSADIVFFDALVPGERDYSAILTKIKGVKPDAILFTGYYPEAGLLLRQMQEMKWAVPIIGGDATNNTDLVKIAGDAAAGYRFISPIMPADIDTPMAKAFLKAYEAKYHSLPSSICSPGTPTTCSSPRSRPRAPTPPPLRATSITI